MKIHYKGLIGERFEDAPFVGSLWIAPDCSHHCPGCCNQHLLDSEVLYEEASEIIEKIKNNPFSEGIILAGLDPLTYPYELINLIDLALDSGLKVMLYTFLPDRYTLLQRLPQLFKHTGKGIYVKYGRYDETKKVDYYFSHGVKLATSNQYIELL